MYTYFIMRADWAEAQEVARGDDERGPPPVVLQDDPLPSPRAPLASLPSLPSPPWGLLINMHKYVHYVYICIYVYIYIYIYV